MNIEITPELVQALRVMRDRHSSDLEFRQAMDVLDNAGIFHKIDEATGYDVDSACTCPADERAKSGTDNHYIECPEAPISKCTCPSGHLPHYGDHLTGCPGDPAEYGDMAFTAQLFDAASSLRRNATAARQAEQSECQCPAENLKFGGHLYACPEYFIQYGGNASASPTA